MWKFWLLFIFFNFYLCNVNSLENLKNTLKSSKIYRESFEGYLSLNTTHDNEVYLSSTSINGLIFNLLSYLKDNSTENQQYLDKKLLDSNNILYNQSDIIDPFYPSSPTYRANIYYELSSLYLIKSLLISEGYYKKNSMDDSIIVSPDDLLSESWKLLSESANMGDPNAQHRLSVAYSSGLFANTLVPIDLTKSLILEYMSARAGHPLASLGLGYRYLRGINVKKSCSRAISYYSYPSDISLNYFEENLLPASDSNKKLYLNNYLLNKKNQNLLSGEVNQDVSLFYKILAEGGDISAKILLGMIYLNGNRYHKKDLQKSLTYFKEAMLAKNPTAIGLYSYILIKDIIKNIERKEEEAFNRIKENKDSHQVMTNIISEDESIEVEDYSENNIEYREFIEKLNYARENDDQNSLLVLGLANYYGIGLQKNVTNAISLLQKCLPVHPDAGFYLGDIMMKSLHLELIDKESMVSEGIGLNLFLNSLSPTETSKKSTPQSSGTSSLDNSEDLLNELNRLGFNEDSTNEEKDRLIKEEEMNLNTQLKEKLSKLKTKKVWKNEDIISSYQAYSTSSRLGNYIALHRLTKMISKEYVKISPSSCETIANNLKSIVDKGPWANSLSEAYRYSDKGKSLISLHLYTQMASIGFHTGHINSGLLLKNLCDKLKINPTFSIEEKQSTFEKFSNIDNATYLPPLIWKKLLQQSKTSTSFSYSLFFKNISSLLSRNLKELISFVSSLFSFSTYSTHSSPVSESFLFNDDEEIDLYKEEDLLPSFSNNFSKESENNSEFSRFYYPPSEELCLTRSFQFFSLSGDEGDTDSLLQLGDYFYSGFGNLNASHHSAYLHYKLASSSSSSESSAAQASFNIGLMHQLGEGIEQDYHLAKRFYDMIYTTTSTSSSTGKINSIFIGNNFFYFVLKEFLLIFLRVHLLINQFFNININSEFLKKKFEKFSYILPSIDEFFLASIFFFSFLFLFFYNKEKHIQTRPTLGMHQIPQPIATEDVPINSDNNIEEEPRNDIPEDNNVNDLSSFSSNEISNSPNQSSSSGEN